VQETLHARIRTMSAAQERLLAEVNALIELNSKS